MGRAARRSKMRRAKRATQIKLYDHNNTFTFYYHLQQHGNNGFCLQTLREKNTMNIPVIYDDETENEFDIELCCASCAKKAYGWDEAKFKSVCDNVSNGIAIKLPNSIDSDGKFKEFVKTL